MKGDTWTEFEVKLLSQSRQGDAARQEKDSDLTGSHRMMSFSSLSRREKSHDSKWCRKFSSPLSSSFLSNPKIICSSADAKKKEDKRWCFTGVTQDSWHYIPELKKTQRSKKCQLEDMGRCISCESLTRSLSTKWKPRMKTQDGIHDRLP